MKILCISHPVSSFALCESSSHQLKFNPQYECEHIYEIQFLEDILVPYAVTNAYGLVFPIIMGCYLFKPGAQTIPSSSCFGQIFVRTTRKATNTHPDYALKYKMYGNVGSRYFCVEYIFICFFFTFQSYEVFYNLMHLKCYKYRKAYINDILQLDVRLSQFLPATSPSVCSLFSSMLLLKF